MQRKLDLVRMLAVLIALTSAYIALARHVYTVQIVRNEELYEKAKQKYTTYSTERGQRGRVFDLHGNLLAGNLACRDVLAEPRRFKQERRREIFNILSQELQVDRGLLLQRFASARKPKDPAVEVVVKRGVEIARAERLAGYGFRGIRFVDTYRRYYPKGQLLANLLGFITPENAGASGVEQLLDSHLQPTSGGAVYERDRHGDRIQTGRHASWAARNGSDVHLTIQEPIQQIVEDELAAMAEQFGPRAAYAVMADPKTGAVMAVAQQPTFDPNNREGTKPAQWGLQLLREGFEPGSIMKSVAVAGALDYGVVTLDDVFDCEHGYWVYCRRPLRDCHPYDDLPVWEIMQKSSNIGVAKIAVQMGEKRLYQTLLRFGFGRPTGIGFPDEEDGIFRPLEKWDGLSVTRFPIGQGILATPLQMVQAYCALANKGLIMQLQIVDRIATPEGRVERWCVPRPKQRAVRPRAARQLVSALKLVTTDGGTAPKAAVEGYEVAGKTGTAQKVIGGQYSHKKFVASFIGFVPADDPAFVLLVVADEPSRGGHYGGTVAAPTFSRIAEKTLRYLQVAPAGRSGAGLTLKAESGAHASLQTVPDLH